MWSSITIISGGQTGADRAALDFALQHGMAHGGWCPRGRRAEDGPIAERYQLQETPSEDYAQRTRWNVRDSDATLLLSISDKPQGGTALTLELARRLGKPFLHLVRDETHAAGGPIIAADPTALAVRLDQFLAEHGVRRLNVAGPRVSQEPEITAFVQAVLSAWRARSGGGLPGDSSI